jgi:hypothetical protein
LRAVINFLAYPVTANHRQLKDVIAAIKSFYSFRTCFAEGLFVAAHALPESLIVAHQIVVIHQQVSHERSATAGITILAVCQTEVFLW